jgi:hypothetical protein
MFLNSLESALLTLNVNQDNLSPDQREQLIALAEASENVREDVTDTLEDEGKRELTPEQQAELLSTLETRFSSEPEHYKRIKGVGFAEVKKALEANPEMMWSLAQMENTGGQPDIVAIEDNAFIFGDCSAKSPDRRNLDYYDSAKMAKQFGVEMMTAEVILKMQETGQFEKNSVSWIATPADILKATHRARYSIRHMDQYEVALYTASDFFEFRGWRGMLRVPRQQ